ncbi:MAG: cyclic nucleotide-binding domain-containing protein [Oligoflexia bacterium]|nr:cyclic nucleotide-binding domain-containing protein [Oligoflexia bacterium]
MNALATKAAIRPQNTTATTAPATGGGEGKSGMITLIPGQILFNDGDSAASLFIIQKGQLRLFKPKGKGFIEIAVLRAGEVIGEMAYFAEEDSEAKRSCSAQAIAQTDIIEISFKAFAKTMSNLNPWFKTIINTLVSRLRKSNTKIKELESNSVSSGYGKSTPEYKFFSNTDIIKLLVSFYLITRTHGEIKGDNYQINRKTLKFYCLDIYNLHDSKFEEFINLLLNQGLVTIEYDNDKFPNILIFNKLDHIRNIFIFMNTQRTCSEEHRIKVNEKCETFLEKILYQIQATNPQTPKVTISLNPIIDDFKSKNIVMEADDLKSAQESGLVGEIFVDNGVMSTSIDYQELRKIFLPIRFTNAIHRVNEKKSKIK